MMKKNNIWMITLWAGTLFFSGVIAGFFVSHLVSPPPPWHNRSGPPPTPPSPEKLKEMISNRTIDRLKLTPEQRQQAMPAIDRLVERMEKLRQKHSPEYLDVFTEFFDRLDAVLTRTQKPELAKLRMEIIEQHSNKGGNSPEKPPRDDDNSGKNP